MSLQYITALLRHFILFIFSIHLHVTHPQDMNTEQNRSRKFAGDLGLYAAGNLGSKLIMFLLLPFYTNYIHDTADYGYYELCVTIVMGLLPVIGMQLGDAGFRFLTGAESPVTRTEITSFILRRLTLNALLFAALSAMIGCFTEIPYFPLVVMYALTQTIYDALMQILRGLGNIRGFMAISIANSFITALSGIVMVTMMDMGILGIFLSVVAARSLSIVLCICSSSIPQLFRPAGHTPPQLRRQLLSYSLPMIPAAVCQWLIPAAIVLIITQRLGLEETGLYAVSAKFASIMFVLTHIFYQTWQQNAIEFYYSPDRSRFFSQIFRLYFYLLTAMTSILPFAIRLNYPWLVGEGYAASSRFLFLNTLLVMLTALTLF